MSLVVGTNVSAINARRALYKNNLSVDNSFQQMSSGSRINKAADDAAGLAISEGMKAQIRSATQARRNANDGISLVQTAEGGLNEIGNIIIRLRELGIQAASDTVGNVERDFIDTEVQALSDEIQRIAESTKWGSTNLLDGTTPVFDFQVGTNNDPFADRISFDASNNVATLAALGLDALDYTTKAGAQAALAELDTAQVDVNRMRSNIGALQNRLVSTVENLGEYHQNISAANSRIRDADIAEVSTNLTKNQILMQAATSTLAQANQKNALALQLLG